MTSRTARAIRSHHRVVHREEPAKAKAAGMKEIDSMLDNEIYACGLVGKAICTGPLSDYALSSAETVTETVRVVANQCMNTGPWYCALERIRAAAIAAGWSLTGLNTLPVLKPVGEDEVTALHCGIPEEEFAQ